MFYKKYNLLYNKYRNKRLRSIIMNEKFDYIKTGNRYTSKVFWETPPHKHSFWEAVIVLMGESVHEVNKHSFNLGEGDMLVMKPGDSHNYKIKTPSNYLHFDLYLTSAAIKNAGDYYNIDFSSMAETTAPIKLEFDTRERQMIGDKLKQLLIIQNSTSEAQHAEILYRYLVAQLVEKYCYVIYKKEQNIPAWYTKLNVAMNDPSVLQSSVENLAHIVNFSHGYLCKIFKNYTGERLIDYFTKMKLDYSKTLMYNPQLNLLQISSMIGYDSVSHYIRVFKKFNSMTPQVYRKKVLNM